jgi:hypothetical protein
MIGGGMKDRHIWLLIIVMWLAVLFGPLVYDRLEYAMDRTSWFDAEIDVLDGGVIAYTQTARRDLTGDWQAWIEVNGQRRCGGFGTGTYRRADHITKHYSIRYFLGADCDLPDQSYRVCASWTHTNQAGYRKSTGPVCSDLVNPQ